MRETTDEPLQIDTNDHVGVHPGVDANGQITGVLGDDTRIEVGEELVLEVVTVEDVSRDWDDDADAESGGNHVIFLAWRSHLGAHPTR